MTLPGIAALGGLPAADRTLLARPPLEFASVEIRFLSDVRELSPALGLDFRQHLAGLGHVFPKFDQTQQAQVMFQLQPGAEPMSRFQQIGTGWQLTSADARTQVTLLPGTVSIQTSDYERWSVSLRPLLVAVLTAVAELVVPQVVTRVGLRYIDRFVDPDVRAADGWRGRIRDELLGLVCHPILGSLVKSAQQQAELALDDTHGVVLRHGPFVDAAAAGAVSYLLDLDVFDAEPAKFDVAETTDRAEALNRTAASLFQSALTAEYLRSLQSAHDPKEVGS